MTNETRTLAELYNSAAADYERTRVPRFRPFVKKLLQLYDTRPKSQVLDAGTGTGLAATMVAPRVGHEGHVIGVDASEAMLTIARQKAKNFGFTQCEFRQGDIQALDFPNGTFDLVICSFALWGEPRSLFSEFRRLVKPSGALLLQNWTQTRSTTEASYDQVFKNYRSVAPSELLEQTRAVLETQTQYWQAVTTPADYEQLLCGVGFQEARAQVETLPQHFDSAAAYVEWRGLQVTQRAELEALDSDRRAEFSRAAVEAVKPFETDKGLGFEWSAIQVVARV